MTVDSIQGLYAGTFDTHREATAYFAGYTKGCDDWTKTVGMYAIVKTNPTRLIARIPSIETDGRVNFRQESLMIHLESEPKPHEISWKWDGNYEKPTLDPSINFDVNSGFRSWHGYLQNGVWVHV